jgi:hypothetical protein
MRDVSDFSGVIRETSWLGGSFFAATIFSYLVTEDKGNQLPFLTITFYLITGLGRVGIALWRKRR